MQWTSPRFARVVLIPLSTLIFFAGLLLASVSYFSDPQRTFTDALISWLQSPGANPHGYLFATGGTALSANLLGPVAWMFYRRLAPSHRAFAAVGVFLFAAGLLAAVLIGCLAPFPATYEPLHLPLAYATFIGVSAGLAICLAVAARAEAQRKRATLMGLAAFMGGVVLLLFYLLLVSDDIFDNKHWYSSLAFLEWLLCVGNAAYTYLLAGVMEGRAARSVAPRV